MTPEAAQDLQAYFGMKIFGDDEEDFESKNENTMKLTESKLRSIIKEELQKLTELGIDRGFLNGYAEALEDMTDRKAYPKTATSDNEDVVQFDSSDGKLDIYFTSGGARGGRTEDVSIQIYDRSGSVRSGFTAPNSSEEAAKRTVEELKKLNAV